MSKLEKLRITDLSKFKITKVKDWEIKFDYEGEKYLLMTSYCDYEDSVTFYKRNCDEKGFVRPEYLDGKYGNLREYMDICERSHGETYSSIDKAQLVKLMTYDGFCTGLFDKEVERVKKEIEEIDDHLSSLVKLRFSLQQQKNRLRRFY